MSQTLVQKLTRTKPVESHASPAAGGLSRSIGLFPLTMIGVGATIGTGIFFTMVEAVPKAGPAVILSFLLAALTAGLTALCYAELSFRIPAAGSSYSFAYATVGEFMAFVMAACLLLEYGLAASAVAIGWSDYLNSFLNNAFGWHIPTALRTPMIVSTPNGIAFHMGHINLPPIILVALCCFLLVRGAKESATTNAIMVLIKLAVLIFFVVIAFTGFDINNFHPFFKEAGDKGLLGMQGVAAAAGTVFFSFIGLDTVATAGEEVHNPKRNVPLGILAALGVVTVFYLLVAVAAMGAQPAHLFEGQEAGLAVILQNVTGKAWPALVLAAGAVISVFSVTLVTIYGQTRILYAISRDGLISKSFHKVSERTSTPVINTLIVSVVVALVAGFVDATFLWDMVSMGTLTAFIVVAVAVPVMRRKERALGKYEKGGFRVPFGAYLVPGLSICACAYLMIGLSNTTRLIFAIWMGATVLTYFTYSVRNSRLNKA
ncbi:APA family basic amino acid/polyamine antiporter [Pseudoduganella lurida]|uniref:APA family basic amino acid/polyamine antiporter n=1 Tax=Pseudoduganella lurida TaxID=1036180 RepID=A0A562QXG7_9BURK|nr:amino acid permease [Pseudoduganella lurida]TWI61492.1 APA family basic amino acid/polyamine antiporter [Pseudoduganella lurida]